MKARMRAMTKLVALLAEYEEEVRSSMLTDSSQDTYIMGASMFVRWVANEFEPGETLL